MKILTAPDERLRRTAKAVEEVNSVLRVQIEKMLDFVDNGVGLAATQVGLDKRVFITNFEETRVFINPVILSRRGLQRSDEGCLSVPKVFGTVTRAREVDIAAWSLDGLYFQLTAKGPYAAVLQHEYDHLNGILFTDRFNDY